MFPSNFNDFTPTVLKRQSPSGSSNAPKRSSNPSSTSQKVKDELDVPVKKYSPEFIRRIVDIRTKQGWTQQVFAGMVNLNHTIIRGIEANSIAYNANYVSRINNYLDKLK